MQFRDLKPGYSIYIFDRNEVNLKETKVVNVTPPYFNNRYNNPGEMVVDVQIEGHNAPCTFKERSDTGVNGDTVYSINRDIIVREVEDLMSKSEQSLAQKDKWEENIRKCKEILTGFSPAFKEKQENEERMGKMENSIIELKQLIMSQQKTINDFVNKFDS